MVMITIILTIANLSAGTAGIRKLGRRTGHTGAQRNNCMQRTAVICWRLFAREFDRFGEGRTADEPHPDHRDRGETNTSQRIVASVGGVLAGERPAAGCDRLQLAHRSRGPQTVTRSARGGEVVSAAVRGSKCAVGRTRWWAEFCSILAWSGRFGLWNRRRGARKVRR
jgi:hypothetical protein